VPFLIFIAVLLAGSVALVVSRGDALRSEGRLDSLLSRETAFLLNNVVLVSLCFVIFWGTFFPLISEAVTGTRSLLGPPWFDRYATPLALALVLLSGIGPALAWGRTTRARIGRIFVAPLAAALVSLLAFVVTGVARGHPLALAMFCAGAFAVTSVVAELWRGTRVRRALAGEPVPVALLSLVSRNRRRYGGYAVHVGMALLFVGVAASSAFQHERDVRLLPGQTAHVGGYDVRYVAPTTSLTSEKISLGAVLELKRHGRAVATLRPSRSYYPSLDDRRLGRIGRFFAGDSTSELGLRSGPIRDVWTAISPDLTTIEPYVRDADRRFPNADPQLEGALVAMLVTRYARNPPPAQFRLIVSPLVAWIWIGGSIVIGGAMIAIWPAPAAARRRSGARVPAPASSRAT
jgi:cytochrome c-type biogenesis protein CcmF